MQGGLAHYAEPVEAMRGQVVAQTEFVTEPRFVGELHRPDTQMAVFEQSHARIWLLQQLRIKFDAFE
ncbi:hypothetical protein D3C83_289080 [compost metagenome]